MVAGEFNADEDMKDAFAQSIIDSSDGVFDDVVDGGRRPPAAVVESPSSRPGGRSTRRLQAEYPPSPAPTREADPLWRRRGNAGLADVSYTLARRVDGTEDAEAVSTDLLEKAVGRPDDRGRRRELSDQAQDQRRGTSPEAAAAFNAVTVDETATRAHIGRAKHVFVVTPTGADSGADAKAIVSSDAKTDPSTRGRRSRCRPYDK